MPFQQRSYLHFGVENFEIIKGSNGMMCFLQDNDGYIIGSTTRFGLYNKVIFEMRFVYVYYHQCHNSEVETLLIGDVEDCERWQCIDSSLLYTKKGSRTIC